MKYIFSIVLTFFAAAIGSTFTTPSIASWYATLNKPFFTPPNWLFGPVWTLLYLGMATAFALVWQKRSKDTNITKPAILYWSQLALNTLWSIVFFGWHAPLFAYIVIIILWLVILLTTVEFFKQSKIAGWLMIPYILWVSFASFLNLAVALLNR